MADSLDGMGSFVMFPLEFNWAVRPSRNLELARILQKFAGSSHGLETFTEDAPERLNIGITPLSKSDEYDLIAFFVARKGRVGKFWAKFPITEFLLKEPALSGSSALLVYRNGAHQQYQGVERIWVGMNDGDILTRHVQSITDDDINDRYSLNLATPLDRDVNVGNHFTLSRLMLVRLDEDKLICNFKSDVFSEIRLRLVELTQEYSLV